MENPFEMDDFRVRLFSETSIYVSFEPLQTAVSYCHTLMINFNFSAICLICLAETFNPPNLHPKKLAPKSFKSD